MRCWKEAGNRDCPRLLQVESAGAAGSAAPGAATSSPGPEGAGVGALGAPPPSRSCALRLASPMAEGRRWEDEEEELGRRARGRALSGHSAAGERREEPEARGEGVGKGRKAGGKQDRGLGTLGPLSSCPRRQRLPRQLTRPDGTPHLLGDFPSSSSLSGRSPRKCTQVSYQLGPRSPNYKFSMRTLNPGAAALDLVTQVMTGLWMSQRPVEDAPPDSLAWPAATRSNLALAV